MTWIGFAAISPNGRVYIYRELTWVKTKIEDWAPTVKDFIDKENVKLVKFCKSAGQDRGQEHTIQEQISKALGTGRFELPVRFFQRQAGASLGARLEQIDPGVPNLLVAAIPRGHGDHATRSNSQTHSDFDDRERFQAADRAVNVPFVGRL
jgi:hypothetical protein